MKQLLDLSRTNLELPFILQTDASAKGMRAVIHLEDQNKKRYIISYASAKLI